MTQEMQLNTNSARRRHANTIECPVTYEPTSTSFYKPSVEPAVMPKKASQLHTVSIWAFVIVGALIGVVSGLFLSNAGNARYLVSYPEAGVIAFFIIWGLLLGALMGLIANALYSAIKKSLPLFALLLFIPTVLCLLTSPLLVVTNLVIELVKIVLAIVVVVIVLVIAWAWLTGG